jgi:Amt family ammonium transporter
MITFFKGRHGNMINSGDTAFVLIGAAMVLLMTPALAFFYGGMARRKNLLSTIMHTFIIICLISVQWVLFGYSIAFGPDKLHLFGSLAWIGLNGVGMAPDPNYAATIPHMVYMAFQMMFAIITTALISGSAAERFRFPAFLIFSVLWATLVYDPIAHWVWGYGGWIGRLGVLDFAGGTVVHISSGVSGLVAALVLGKRRGYGKDPMPPHNIPYVVLGAGMLWFGWFGFNACSALAANGLAADAFVMTNTAAAAAGLAWVAVEWIRTGKPTVMGAVNGSIAGLVAITPACGFVNPIGSIAIGLGAGIICYLSINVLKEKLGYDDALDTFSLHGIGGTFGALATGLFATTAVNAHGANGLFYGNPGQLWLQLIGVVTCWAFSAIATFIILKVVSLITPLRASKEEELMGLDLCIHGENAYIDEIACGYEMACLKKAK